MWLVVSNLTRDPPIESVLTACIIRVSKNVEPFEILYIPILLTKLILKNQYVYLLIRDIFQDEILFYFEFSATFLLYCIVGRRPSLMHMSYTISFETGNLRFHKAP